MSFFKRTNTTKPEKKKIYECGVQCRRFSNGKLKPYGGYGKKILIILPSIGEERCREVYAPLFNVLKEEGVCERDYQVEYAVCCKGSANISTDEILSCRHNIIKKIKDLSPELVFLVGEESVESVIGSVWRQDVKSIHRWRGYVIPDQTLKTFLVPIYDPYMFEEYGQDVLCVIYRQDIQKGLKALETQFPDNTRLSSGECVNIVERDSDAFLTVMDELLSITPEMCAFDYETTGLKPHKAGHTIVSASVCYDGKVAHSFMFPKKEKGLSLWRTFLSNKRIGKIASNLQFEHIWSMAVCGTAVRGWLWDTAIVGHIYDNRPEVCGLKFLTYVTYGIAGYESDVGSFLKADGANATNNIHRIPEKTLLLYGGYDSLFEYKIAKKQMKTCDTITGERR